MYKISPQKAGGRPPPLSYAPDDIYKLRKICAIAMFMDKPGVLNDLELYVKGSIGELAEYKGVGER